MCDVKKLLRNNSGVTLWCMGVSAKPTNIGKRTCDKPDSGSENSESDEEPRRKQKRKSTKRSKNEEKQERIDNIIDELKTKHGTIYTDIQYQVWAESYDTRYHQSLDEPPRGSLFKSQGRKSKSSTTADPPPGTDLTPQKAANLKSTYIQQIKELHSLQQVGAITSDDFVKQRDILLAQMTKM